MAGEILFADAFESYGVSTGIWGSPARDRMLRNYSHIGLFVAITDTVARSGSHSFSVDSAGAISDNFVTRVLDATETEIIIGCGIMIDGAPANSTAGFAIKNAGGADMASVRINPDTSLSVRDKDGNDRGTSRPLISPGVFHHVQIRFTYAPGENGQVEIRCDQNATADILSSAVDMGETPIASFSFGQLTLSGAGTETYFDDLFVMRGGVFPGPLLMVDDAPDGDGPETDWALTGAVTTHECLDEAIYNDTDYITGSVAGDKSSITFPDAPANFASIKGVYVYAVAKTSEPGEGAFKINCHSDVAVAAGSELTPLADYRFFGTGYHVDPATGFAWEETGFNAMVIEFEKTA